MNDFTTKEERQSCIKEAKVLQSLRHENITEYIDSFAENRQFHIVMEYVDGGDLSEMLAKERKRG